ncbi:MAG TPA: hypothetical protein VMW46_09405 [Candidatus Desulfaltia sp.]|nr:hypothetical protein [Candidatus Desulfaltia sp.]
MKTLIITLSPTLSHRREREDENQEAEDKSQGERGDENHGEKRGRESGGRTLCESKGDQIENETASIDKGEKGMKWIIKSD